MTEEQNAPSDEEKQKPVSEVAQNKNVVESQESKNKNMEVHHHPDLHHRKKHWKEYFLEFIMIFLAVTMGFFAESYREHLSDRAKEKEYIKSMVEDLKTDSAFLEQSINKLIPYHLSWLDSTVHLLQTPILKGKDRQIYQAFIIATGWGYTFNPTERTLTQLRTEGYHLIRNKNTSIALSQLEAQYKLYLQSSINIENMQDDIDISAYTFADKNVTNKITFTAFQNFSEDYSIALPLSNIPQFATIDTTNKEAIKLYADKLRKYNFHLQNGITAWYVHLARVINKTIDVLNKEYNLQ